MKTIKQLIKETLNESKYKQRTISYEELLPVFIEFVEGEWTTEQLEEMRNIIDDQIETIHTNITIPLDRAMRNPIGFNK